MDLFNPNDGLTGRDGGPYLDLEEARIAEERRAVVEGREPDFKNIPAHAGIPLATAPELQRMSVVNNTPSQDVTQRGVDSAMVDALVKDENHPLVRMGEIPDEFVKNLEESTAEGVANTNPSNPPVEGDENNPTDESGTKTEGTTPEATTTTTPEGTTTSGNPPAASTSSDTTTAAPAGNGTV